MCLNWNIIFIASVITIIIVHSKNIPRNNNTAIITEYAKVAHWGSPISNNTQQIREKTEGRSNGQSLWTHRSDVNIVGSQNIRTSKPSVVYHYPVPRKPQPTYHRVGEDKHEILPAVGEVQDRFNPRPYFDYAHVPSKYDNMKPSKSSNSPAPAPAPPAPPTAPTFDSFPVFSKPPSNDPPNNPSSSDLYSSPFSSYNPPKSESSENSGGVAYPPNAPPPPDGTVDAPPSDSDDSGYSYNPPKPDTMESDSPPKQPEGPPKPSYPSVGPPLAPPDHDDHPPKDEQLYYPPSDDTNHPEIILDHPPPGYKDDGDSKPPMMPADMPMMPSDMPMMPSAMMPPAPLKDHDMAEHDLSPPPAQDDTGDARFPQYLYNGGHGDDFHYPYDDHHVYKEITTTTTEAPEDERVNKGNYSYYYLGRKLWYIPLYFSVYFIIYVTVLILKSIARHKIQFKHKFHYDAKEARSLNADDVVDEIHENVTTAIDTSRKKYAYIAM